MQSQSKNLRTTLKNSLAGARKIAILGIGSDLRADDVAGMLASEGIARSCARSKTKVPAKVYFGGTAPENLTGEIKRFKPSHIIMIDSIDLKKKPGTIFALQPEQVGGGASFSTHKMPARVLVDYLLKSFPCSVVIVGIQPKTVEFGKALTKEVERSSRETARTIAGLLKR